MSNRLLTAEQVASEFGFPSARTVRWARCNGLPAVKLGKCFLFDATDVAAFLAARKVTICPVETVDPISISSRSAGPGIFSGAKPDARASAARAQATAQRLKTLSRASFKSASDPVDQPGRLTLAASR
jgi:excisionase family DNA binding protein